MLTLIHTAYATLLGILMFLVMALVVGTLTIGTIKIAEYVLGLS